MTRPDAPRVSILCIARDAQAHLARLLRHLQPLRSAASHEVIVVIDDRTRDASAACAARMGAQVAHATFAGFGAMREHAHSLCNGVWTLCLDADEYPEPALQARIAHAIAQTPRCAWALALHTRIGGARTRRGPFAREWRARLFPTAAGRWDPRDSIHEALTLDVPLRRLRGGVVQHHTAPDALTCWARHERYGLAMAHARHDPRHNTARACAHAAARLAKGLLLHGGALAGPPGWAMACCQARATYLKWAAPRR